MHPVPAGAEGWDEKLAFRVPFPVTGKENVPVRVNEEKPSTKFLGGRNGNPAGTNAAVPSRSIAAKNLQMPPLVLYVLAKEQNAGS